MQRIDSSSINEIDSEISLIEIDNKTPYVEKSLKLGYLYYSKDFLGTASKIFKKLAETISKEKNNFEFIKENEKDLNILYMGWHIVPDGCGGFDVFETDCCADSCGPICGCLGLVVVMSVCGISADDVCSYDVSTGTSGGCVGECGKGCCNGCAPCCGCNTEFT